MSNQEGAGVISRILNQFPCLPGVSDEQMMENVRSALARKGLHEFGMFKRHDRAIAVAAGGPSLEDTYKELDGDIAAVNGSLGFLRGKDITPWACGVLDPGEHMAEVVEAVPGVIYFVASVCHPKTFDHLQGAGCDIVLWHPSGLSALDSEPGVTFQVGGGCTMGLRWVNIAYLLGFRRFALHGLDSSYRSGKTHAYPDRRDAIGGDAGGITIRGHNTALNFVQQVQDFFETMDRFSQPDIEPCEFDIYGSGLLQELWRNDPSFSILDGAERDAAHHAGGQGSTGG